MNNIENYLINFSDFKQKGGMIAQMSKMSKLRKPIRPSGRPRRPSGIRPGRRTHERTHERTHDIITRTPIHHPGIDPSSSAPRSRRSAQLRWKEKKRDKSRKARGNPYHQLRLRTAKYKRRERKKRIFRLPPLWYIKAAVNFKLTPEYINCYIVQEGGRPGFLLQEVDYLKEPGKYELLKKNINENFPDLEELVCSQGTLYTKELVSLKEAENNDTLGKILGFLCKFPENQDDKNITFHFNYKIRWLNPFSDLLNPIYMLQTINLFTFVCKSTQNIPEIKRKAEELRIKIDGILKKLKEESLDSRHQIIEGAILNIENKIGPTQLIQILYFNFPLIPDEGIKYAIGNMYWNLFPDEVDGDKIIDVVTDYNNKIHIGIIISIIIFDLANPNAIYRSFNKRTTDKGKVLDERLINLAEEFTLLLEKTKTPLTTPEIEKIKGLIESDKFIKYFGKIPEIDLDNQIHLGIVLFLITYLENNLVKEEPEDFDKLPDGFNKKEAIKNQYRIWRKKLQQLMRDMPKLDLEKLELERDVSADLGGSGSGS